MACWVTLKSRRFRGSSSSSTETNCSRGKENGAKEGKEEKEEKEEKDEKEEREEKEAKEEKEKERKEEKEDATVDKVVMDAEIQIFVKADGREDSPDGSVLQGQSP